MNGYLHACRIWRGYSNDKPGKWKGSWVIKGGKDIDS